MLKTVLIATHPNRRAMLKVCLSSLTKFAPSWRVIVFENELGPGLARHRMLQEQVSDVWCLVDDDMELTEQTNWEPAVSRSLQTNVGLVSCNWVRSRKIRKQCKEVFTRQSIVHVAGGMLFSNATADLIRSQPAVSWKYDDSAWSAMTYVAGRDNYRYLGSVCIHRICSKGGRKTFVDSQLTVEPDPRWFRYRFNHIPLSSDLTPEAKERHALAKQQAHTIRS